MLLLLLLPLLVVLVIIGRFMCVSRQCLIMGFFGYRSAGRAKGTKSPHEATQILSTLLLGMDRSLQLGPRQSQVESKQSI